LAVRGIAALATALAVPVVMALSFWPDKTGNPVRDVEYHARRLVVVLVYGGLVVPMLTYGWRCLRLARRVLRGDTA